MARPGTAPAGSPAAALRSRPAPAPVPGPQPAPTSPPARPLRSQLPPRRPALPPRRPFMAGCTLWANCRPLLDTKNPATNLSSAFGTCECVPLLGCGTLPHAGPGWRGARRPPAGCRLGGRPCCAAGLPCPRPALAHPARSARRPPPTSPCRLRHGGHGGLGLRGPGHEPDEGWVAGWVGVLGNVHGLLGDADECTSRWVVGCQPG